MVSSGPPFAQPYPAWRSCGKCSLAMHNARRQSAAIRTARPDTLSRPPSQLARLLRPGRRRYWRLITYSTSLSLPFPWIGAGWLAGWAAADRLQLGESSLGRKDAVRLVAAGSKSAPRRVTPARSKHSIHWPSQQPKPSQRPGRRRRLPVAGPSFTSRVEARGLTWAGDFGGSLSSSLARFRELLIESSVSFLLCTHKKRKKNPPNSY